MIDCMDTHTKKIGGQDSRFRTKFWGVVIHGGGFCSNSCFSGTISLIKLNFSVSVIGFLMVTSALSRHLRELELRYCNKTRTKLIDIKNVYTGKKSEVVHFSRIPSRSKHAA